jgi:hypothetical protein
VRLAILGAAVLVGAAGASPTPWARHTALPVARTEVAAGAITIPGRGETEIAVVGGLTASGGTSARVDRYSPRRGAWTALSRLPIAVHHAAVVGDRGELFVLGGYSRSGRPLGTAWVHDGDSWRPLPNMPLPRAAAGAALTRGRIVVAGGVGEGRRLARKALSFDLRTRRWSLIPGPTPREHLGVASLGGVVYAVGGRTAGLGTNVARFESYRPGDGSWRRLKPVPEPRGGTGAAAAAGAIVSAGGEELGGTIASVYAYRVAERRWVRLPDLPTPRHGLGVAAVGGRVFVIGGGPAPGLTVSSANESLVVRP